MGFVKDVKSSTATNHAARARQEGRTVFLYRFNVSATVTGFSGPVEGAAEVIECVERAGWQLVDMTYGGAQSKTGAVLLLFRLLK